MRHGTRRSIESGCGCEGCRLMSRLYPPRPPKLPYTATKAAVPLPPFLVVLEAVLSRGLTVPIVAAFCGLPPKTLYRIRSGDVGFIRESTATRLRRMTLLLPSERIPA